MLVLISIILAVSFGLFVGMHHLGMEFYSNQKQKLWKFMLGVWTILYHCKASWQGVQIYNTLPCSNRHGRAQIGSSCLELISIVFVIFLICWICEIDYPGKASKWARNCSKKTSWKIRSRAARIQKWSNFYFSTSTSKSCEASWLLHPPGRNITNLWVLAKQKFGLLPFWLVPFTIFPLSIFMIDPLNYILLLF